MVRIIFINKMLSKIFGSKMSRTAMLSAVRQQNLLFKTMPKRSVSLLINDQFLDEEQKLIQKTAYDFAERELEPFAAEWDEKKHFPMDVYKKAAELGFAGIYVDPKYGGCGLSRLEASLIFEGLSTGKTLKLSHYLC